jgi:tRNA G26 N,N-dimethylase Trm1
MAATGLRSIRVAKELKMNVASNDIATRSNILNNARLNDVNLDIYDLDADHFMYTLDQPHKFKIVDLDPFGSSIPFLFSALDLEPEILAMTFTDLELLC